jgi:hypothetical protein
MLDGLKRSIALTIIRSRFSDERLRSDSDSRIAAIVAAVPTAADFDPESFKNPRVPLALITAQQDRWLIPRFHSQVVLDACKPCEHLDDLPGGHGALLSPLPPGMTGLLGNLLNDPPGYSRERETATVDEKVTGYFAAHLMP